MLQLCVQEEMKEKHKKELETVEVNSKCFFTNVSLFIEVQYGKHLHSVLPKYISYTVNNFFDLS